MNHMGVTVDLDKNNPCAWRLAGLSSALAFPLDLGARPLCRRLRGRAGPSSSCVWNPRVFADDARGWQCPFMLCLHPQGCLRRGVWSSGSYPEGTGKLGSFVSSKEQASFNFMAAITICSDFGAQKNKVSHCVHCFPDRKSVV